MRWIKTPGVLSSLTNSRYGSPGSCVSMARALTRRCTMTRTMDPLEQSRRLMVRLSSLVHGGRVRIPPRVVQSYVLAGPRAHSAPFDLPTSSDDTATHDSPLGSPSLHMSAHMSALHAGRAKLQAMTTKGDPKAAEDRMTLFKRIDADGSRGVTPSEVFKAVQKMWPEFDSMAAVRSAFKAADRTGDGRIQKKEIRILLKYLLFYDEAWELFKKMDTNANGKLELDEFTLGINMLSLKEEVGDVEAEFATMNLDEGKGVELDEFAAWLAAHSRNADGMAEDLERAASD
eukprot:m.195504 g.195504  ORF g.195504 m.195504 type:complete len:288 (+) comp25034_c1_seq17:4583-5446(+)